MPDKTMTGNVYPGAAEGAAQNTGPAVGQGPITTSELANIFERAEGQAEGTEVPAQESAPPAADTEGEIPEGGEPAEAAEGEAAPDAAPAESTDDPGSESSADDLSHLTDDEPKGTDPKGVEKRIGKLLAEKRELEQRLAAAEAKAQEVSGPPAAEVPTALASINDLDTLQAAETRHRQVLDLAEDLMDALTTDPEEVEQRLRGLGVSPKDANGNEDWSVPAMGRLLRAERRLAKSTLEAVPRVAAKLRQRVEHAQAARKAFAFLTEPDDERTEAVQRVLARNPEIQRMPYAEYWATCAVLKHRELQAAMKRGTPSVPAKPAPKAAPRATGAVSKPPTAAGFGKAVERLRGERSKDALADVFAEM